jgi:hypothetical protein
MLSAFVASEFWLNTLKVVASIDAYLIDLKDSELSG